MKRERWPGGYIHRQNDGQRLYVIEREVGGVRFHASTRCHTKEAAMAQLKRFEADPAHWSPSGITEGAVMITNELILEYRAFGLTVKRNSRRHCNEQAHLLTAWMEALGAVDLRRLNIFTIREKLTEWGNRRRHRIIAIKAFCAWLRKEKGLLKHADDATLDVAVPRAIPEKHRRKKVVELERIAAAWSKLEGPYADMLQVLAGTSMHIAELERFIRLPDAKLEMLKAPLKDGTRASLITPHKSGDWAKIPLKHPEHIAAAQRLKARGQVPRWFTKHVKAACRAAGVEEFGPGQMRTSGGTFALEQGATREQISSFLHHKDKRTTERFYIDTNLPAPAVPVAVLRRQRRRMAARRATGS